MTEYSPDLAEAFKVWWREWEKRDPATADLYCRALDLAHRNNGTINSEAYPTLAKILPTAKRTFRRFTLFMADRSGPSTPKDVIVHPRLPRYALHAAHMLGEALLLEDKHPNTVAKLLGLSAASAEGVALVSALCWSNITWEYPISIGVRGNSLFRDGNGSFWGVWLIRLQYYASFPPAVISSNSKLPIIPIVPGRFTAMTAHELEMQILEEQRHGAAPFLPFEWFAEIYDELEPRERKYIQACAAASYEIHKDPARYDREKRFTFWRT